MNSDVKVFKLQSLWLYVKRQDPFVAATQKSFINTVQCNTVSDTQRSRRGPGMSTSGCFARKIKETNVEFLLKLRIFDIINFDIYEVVY